MASSYHQLGAVAEERGRLDNAEDWYRKSLVTDDPVAAAARAAAGHLAAQYGPGLATEVEAALHARSPEKRPEQYSDPVALGSLIVSIADLAWTIYTGLKAKTSNPAPEVLARAVRVELRTRGDNVTASQDRITDVVVADIIQLRIIESGGPNSPANPVGSG